MKKIAVLILFLMMAMNSMAQNYIKRTAKEPVYDIEVIVFSRALSQPPAEFVQQAQVYDQKDAVIVKPIPADEDWPIIKNPPVETEQDRNTQLSETIDTDQASSESAESSENWQVPLEEKPIDYEVLVWYLKSNHLNAAVVDRLMNNPKYLPLLRQVWRQPTTPFSEPLYVQVNSESEADNRLDPISNLENKPHNSNDDASTLNEISYADNDQMGDAFNYDEDAPSYLGNNIIKDHQINGQVALSEGRYTHLHIKFNYYRINNEDDVLIYASKQQRQIKLNQWQYFDHNQFGVLVKVTPLKAEELL